MSGTMSAHRSVKQQKRVQQAKAVRHIEFEEQLVAEAEGGGVVVEQTRE